MFSTSATVCGYVSVRMFDGDGKQTNRTAANLQCVTVAVVQLLHLHTL
jgi:hypothetical protein